MASINGGVDPNQKLQTSLPLDLEPGVTFCQKSFSDKQRWLQLKNRQKTAQGEKRWYTSIFHFFGAFCYVDFYEFHEALGVFSAEKANIQ